MTCSWWPLVVVAAMVATAAEGVRTTRHAVGGGLELRLLQRDFEGRVLQTGRSRHRGDGTGTTLWPAALPTLSYVQKLMPALSAGLDRPLRVLELGAGCGLLGLGLACSGADVLLTEGRFDLGDGTTSFDWLEANVGANGDAVRGGSAACAPLNWGDAADCEAIDDAHPRGFDVVVGSDLLYVPEAHGALHDTLVRFAATTDEAATRRDDPPAAVIGYNVRNGSELRFGADSDMLSVTQEVVYGAPSKPGKNPVSKTVSLFRLTPTARNSRNSQRA